MTFSTVLPSWQLDRDRFLSLLQNLIGESRHLQNSPPNWIPEEARIVEIVTRYLANVCAENGAGPVQLWRHEFVSGRPNLILKYPATGSGANEKELVDSFTLIGSHMDVVPVANPESWERRT